MPRVKKRNKSRRKTRKGRINSIFMTTNGLKVMENLKILHNGL